MRRSKPSYCCKGPALTLWHAWKSRSRNVRSRFARFGSASAMGMSGVLFDVSDIICKHQSGLDLERLRQFQTHCQLRKVEEMTTFRWQKSPQYLNNSTQFRWKMEIHRFDPLPSPVYSKSSTWSILVDRENPHGGKVWSEPDSTLAYFGGSKNPHGGKEVWSEPDFNLAYLFGWIEKSMRWKRSMDRTRLRLSLFWWIENSTRCKSSMVRTRLRLSLFGWIEKSWNFGKIQTFRSNFTKIDGDLGEIFFEEKS